MEDYDYERQSGEDWCLTLLNFIECYGNPMEVDQLEDGNSPYGYNMIANVKEWVADLYGEKYYHVSPNNNPAELSNGFQKAVRGGAWKYEKPDVYKRFWFFTCQQQRLHWIQLRNEC